MPRQVRGPEQKMIGLCSEPILFAHHVIVFPAACPRAVPTRQTFVRSGTPLNKTHAMLWEVRMVRLRLKTQRLTECVVVVNRARHGVPSRRQQNVWTLAVRVQTNRETIGTRSRGFPKLSHIFGREQASGLSIQETGWAGGCCGLEPAEFTPAPSGSSLEEDEEDG